MADYTARLVAGYIIKHEQLNDAIFNAELAGFDKEVIEDHLEKLSEYTVNSDYILVSHWYAVAGPGEANRVSPMPTENNIFPMAPVRDIAKAMELGIDNTYNLYLVLREW